MVGARVGVVSAGRRACTASLDSAPADHLGDIAVAADGKEGGRERAAEGTKSARQLEPRDTVGRPFRRHTAMARKDDEDGAQGRRRHADGCK